MATSWAWSRTNFRGREVDQPVRIGELGTRRAAHRVERLAVEAASRRGEDHAEDLVVLEPVRPQPLDIRRCDAVGVERDGLGEVHERDLERLEAGVMEVAD